MDRIFLNGVQFIPRFHTDDLDKRKLYFIDNPKITSIKGYESKVVEFSSRTKKYHTKVLYSNYEVDAYLKLEGLNITPKLIGMSEIQGFKTIVIEHMEPLHISNVTGHIIYSLISKVEAIHKIGVIHGDIKIDNLLYKDGEVYICDFEDKGFTESHAAPELLNSFETSESTDMYALGCTVFEMVTGLKPWSWKEDFEDLVLEEDFTGIESYLLECKWKDLILKLLKGRCV